MASFWARRAPLWVGVGSIGVAAALSACSSSDSSANGASGGSSGSAGASAASAGASAAGASGSAGAPSAGAGGASAGTSAGGSAAGTGGAASADAAGSAVAGAAGSTGSAGTGGAGNCAGNAVSLSANGTGTASDAAHARVVIDLLNDLPIGNAHRTVEFWAYIQPSDWLGEKNEVYVYGSPGTTNTAFGLDFGSNAVTGMPSNHATLNPYTNGNFTEDSQADLGVTSAAAQWLHVAMTWDGTTLKTYVNGALKLSKTNAGSQLATTSSALTMGCNPPINNCFNGLFDELRVWNVDRSASDIQANYRKPLTGSESGLVGYWKFDEAPGASNAADAVNSAGHSAHAGQLVAENAAQKPTFVTAMPPAPLVCP